jgi:hypothetical protein
MEKEVETKEEENDDEEAEPEEEVTRCICGQPEYPGPPAWIRERLLGDGEQDSFQSCWNAHTNSTITETLSDDLGNFFVQCDSCQVWQHGGCMGLTDESMLPEQYYCEQCRPESHKIIIDRNGYVQAHGGLSAEMSAD